MQININVVETRNLCIVESRCCSKCGKIKLRRMTLHSCDKINVLQASLVGMHRALDQLKQQVELILVDGNKFNPYRDIPHHCIIKGDGKYMSIAAASILAKTYRDDLMENLAVAHPEYGWERNAGYPTKEHRSAIEKYGITPYHRKSFRLLPIQTELFC